ncbi:MAG: tail fiber domain-containing protein [Phycisphaerales bacterium]|nr:tail fiber domain-containing protein [Phycisphaerales bacterium]
MNPFRARIAKSIAIMSTVAVFLSTPATALAQTGTPASNEFTFQGRLNFNNMPVNIDLQVSFQLFANPTGNGINDVVSEELIRTVQFDNQGYFSVPLDFGQTYNGYQIFNGDDRYLQIILLDPPGGLEKDIPLSPRTKVTAAPLAAYALDARTPTLSEITNETLESTDTQGSLALNVLDDDLGLTIRPNGGIGTLFTYSGIHPTNPFEITTTQGPLSLKAEQDDLTLASSVGDISLIAELGKLDIFSNQRMSISTSSYGSIVLEPSGLKLDAPILELDASSSIDINGASGLSLSTVGLLSLDGAIITLQGNQFDGANVIINRNLLATINASKPGGGPWAVLSDIRHKKNIAPLQGSLQTLLQLRPITYHYTDPANPMYLPGTQTGFAAQQVRQILPEWIEESSDGTLLLSPRGFEAMVVGALQELRAEKDAQIQHLQSQNDMLQARLERLEAIMLKHPNN